MDFTELTPCPPQDNSGWHLLAASLERSFSQAPGLWLFISPWLSFKMLPSEFSQGKLTKKKNSQNNFPVSMGFC